MLLTSKKAVFVLSFLLFLSPSLIRAINYSPENIIGFTTYFHVRMADLISQGSFYDPLSYGGRPYTYPPGFPAILSLFPGMFKVLLNPLLGAVFVVLFYDYSVRKLGKKTGEYALFFLITSPGFIYLSSHINPRLLALLLIFFVYYLLNFKDKDLLRSAAVMLSMIAVVLVHPLVFVVGSIIGFFIFSKDRSSLIPPVLAGLMVLFAMFFVNGGLPQSSIAYANFSELQRGMQYFIFETGTAASSVSVLTWIIGLYGFFVYHKKLRLESRWLVLAVVVPLIGGNRLNEFVYYPLALFAAVGFSKLGNLLKEFNMSSKTKVIRRVVLVYLLGVLLYYPLFFSNIGPQREDFQLLSWADDHLPKNAVVLSGFAEGHWVTGIAHRKNFWDAYVEYAPEVDERTILASQVFNGYSPALRTLVCKYNVSYAYLHIYSYMEKYKYPSKELFERNGRIVNMVRENENGEYAVLYELDRQHC